jgi:predicted nucleotidyltransferase
VSALLEFDARGDLPTALHRATLSEVLARFGAGSEQRQLVAQRLERIYRLASSTGALARFIVFGSFITDKAAPNDVDIFLVMEDRFESAKVTGETRCVFHHMDAHNLLGASVFWVPRAACLGGEAAAVLDWQIKRDGTRRGIVEIIP